MMQRALWVHRVRAAEGSALRALKEKLFTHRSELILGFQQYDHNNTGLLFSLTLLKYNVHLSRLNNLKICLVRYYIGE